jgi:hypothetical protein
VESLSRTRAITNNGLQLQEVGEFNQNAFPEKNFSSTKNFSLEQDAANFL